MSSLFYTPAEQRYAQYPRRWFTYKASAAGVLRHEGYVR